MELEIINKLTSDFESFSNKTEDGVYFWYARDLQKLLGYKKWDNFKNVIKKAKRACELSNQNISDHFSDASKMVQIGSSASRNIDDIRLTRYASYLIAQNGDSRKEAISFAQTYFAIQTRKVELIEQRILEQERIYSRKKLSQTEKELSKVIFEQTGKSENFAFIRSNGDKALFNHTTQEMKNKWGVDRTKPLADFMPTILLKAKDFASEITIYNAKEKGMSTENKISNEHITNNKAVRDTLLSRGIVPEKVKPQEDIEKIERKLNSETNKMLKIKETLIKK